MDALKVCHLGSIACFYQSVETGLHQLGHAAAENCLLTEQVGLGLFTEGGLQNACTACADTACICQSIILGLAGSVLIYSDQRGNAFAFHILAADSVAGALRCDHDDVDILGGDDLLEVDVEAVSEAQDVAGLHVLGNFVLVNVSLHLVGNKHHDDVALLSCLFDAVNFQTGIFGLLNAGGGLTETNDNVDAGFLQVLCVCVTLGTIAQDGNGLALEQAQITVFVIILFDHSRTLLLYSTMFNERFMRRCVPCRTSAAPDLCRWR